MPLSRQDVVREHLINLSQEAKGKKTAHGLETAKNPPKICLLQIYTFL